MFSSLLGNGHELGRSNDSRAYRGMARRASGCCKGLYEVSDAAGTCTHGPDVPMESWTDDVTRTVPPLTAAELKAGVVPAASAEVAAIPAPAPVCVGDGSSGNRTEVLYVREAGKADRYGQYLPSFRAWSQGMDGILEASANDIGGSRRRIRFVTEGNCQIVVRNAVVPNGATASFGSSIDAVKAAGYNRRDRKYVMYIDATVLCGVAGVLLDSRADQGNGNNFGPSFARVDSGCWGAATATHELVHTLGAVMAESPNSTPYGHCTDDYDLMCYLDGPGVSIRIVCGDRSAEDRLDCNKDDYYFSANPRSGSWLATRWHTANNQFLISGPTPNQPPPPPAVVTTGSQVRGPGGKCVDVEGDDTGGDGAAVLLWDCQAGARDQHWSGSAARCVRSAAASTRPAVRARTAPACRSGTATARPPRDSA